MMVEDLRGEISSRPYWIRHTTISPTLPRERPGQAEVSYGDVAVRGY